MENNTTNFTPPPQATPVGPTKACKHCKSVIPKAAKVCPYCQKKQGGIAKWIIIAVVVLFIIGAAAGGGNDSNKGDSTPSSTVNTQNAEGSTKENSTPTPESEPEIEYTSYTVQNLIDDVQSNAMKASETYKGTYVEITGILSNIDASGKYISLKASEDDYSFVSVQCYIKDDAQKSRVMEMSSGDTVTLKGQVTDVGEVLGYSIDIIEIQ